MGTHFRVATGIGALQPPGGDATQYGRGALDALVADQVLVAAVGPELVENHVFIKRHEIDRVGALEGDAKRDYYIYYI